MNRPFKHLILAVAGLLATSTTLAGPVIEEFDVHANNNVWNEGLGVDNILNTDPGLSTGIILALGEDFSVYVNNVTDTWNYCTSGAFSSCEVDADGTRIYDGNTSLGNYVDSGYAFIYGSLVGRVGSGVFFHVGTAGFTGFADVAGELRLYHWDHNTNNGGTIRVSVETTSIEITDAPIPSSLLLLPLGLTLLRLQHSHTRSS